MDCREFLLRYSDYDDSLIPPREAAEFRDHMASCASCARYDRVLRKGRMLARQLPGLEPDPDFIPRLRLRLRYAAGARARGRLASAARLAMGLAAVTILMVASTVMLLDGSTPAAASVDAAGPAGRVRVVVLPPVERVEPRAWAARKVAPAPTASYSPLETGPPAYRMAASRTVNSRRALD